MTNRTRLPILRTGIRTLFILYITMQCTGALIYWNLIYSSEGKNECSSTPRTIHLCVVSFVLGVVLKRPLNVYASIYNRCVLFPFHLSWWWVGIFMVWHGFSGIKPVFIMYLTETEVWQQLTLYPSFGYHLGCRWGDGLFTVTKGVKTYKGLVL